jgi:hypothetical protein
VTKHTESTFVSELLFALLDHILKCADVRLMTANKLFQTLLTVDVGESRLLAVMKGIVIGLLC